MGSIVAIARSLFLRGCRPKIARDMGLRPCTMTRLKPLGMNGVGSTNRSGIADRRPQSQSSGRGFTVACGCDFGGKGKVSEATAGRRAEGREPRKGAGISGGIGAADDKYARAASAKTFQGEEDGETRRGTEPSLVCGGTLTLTLGAEDPGGGDLVERNQVETSTLSHH